MCVHGRGAGWSLAGSTPTRRRRSTLAAAPDSPYVGGRRRTSVAAVDQLMITFASPPSVDSRNKNAEADCLSVLMRRTHLDLHALGLDDVDLVLVAAPNLVVDHSHAADGVMRPAEVHQVVVGQIPLAVCSPNHTHP